MGAAAEQVGGAGSGGASGWLGLVPVVPAMIGGLCACWSASLPAGSFLGAMAALALWGLAGVAWFGIGLVWAIERRRGRSLAGGWGLVVAPVAVVCVGALIVGNVPLDARWRMSEGAFDAAVSRELDARPEVSGEPGERIQVPVSGRIGAYRVSSAWRMGDDVFFVVEGGGGIFTEEGFARLSGEGPTPSPARYGLTDLEPLGDGWFTWQWVD